MRWTSSAGVAFVVALLACVLLLPGPSEAVGSSVLSKRPRIDFRTWLKSIYPQIADEEDIVGQVGASTGQTGSQDKRNRDEDYGHLR